MEDKENLLLTELVDMNKWQQIQDNFSEVIGAGLRTFDPEGKLITKPSRTPRFCSEVVVSSPIGLKRCRNCRPMFMRTQEGEKVPLSFFCHAGPQNFVVPIVYDSSKTAAYMVIGPVLFGKREELDKCEGAAGNLGIGNEILVDALREIKTFTFRGIQLAVSLLEEVSSYICRLSYEKIELGIKTLESSLAVSGDDGFSKSDSSENMDGLLRTLLDVTLKTVKAEMGSIMLLDRESGDLFVKVAKGLKEEAIRDARVKAGEGIAGLVARSRQALLLDEQVKDPEVKSRLKRPEIQSALVAPLKINNEVIGVLNVGTTHSNGKFTRDNLNLIIQLANRAGEVAHNRL